MDDDTIDGYRIPAGARMMLSPYVTQRSQRYWEEPALFRPERFLTDDTYQPDAYFPFGAGPRQCIGNRFALMEGTLILATIAQQLRLARLDSKPIAAMPLATLRPDRPIYVQAYRRYHSY
jgi:cytochrome P450